MSERPQKVDPVRSKGLSDFVFAADDGYSIPLRVAVGSLLNSCIGRGGEIVIHVLDLGISDANWQDCAESWRRLRPTVLIVRYPISPSRYARMRLWRGSVATYARIDIPELLRGVEWCCYFDCDTLIVRDPRELSSFCESDFAILGRAVREDIIDAVDGRWFREKGLEIDRNRYVCAGILLMNLSWFRSHGTAAKCFDFLLHYPDSVTADQTALNYVCKGSVGLLPDEWGLGSDETMKATSCSCVHFAGTVPWRNVSDIGFFCGEHRLADLWRRLAIERLGVTNEELPNLSLKRTWMLRSCGCITWHLLVTLSVLNCIPGRLGGIVKSVRQRRQARAVARLRELIFCG